LKNIIFDVNELIRLDKIEQAQRFEEAERQIDEIQRIAAGNPSSQQWVVQQRKYIMKMQYLLFES